MAGSLKHQPHGVRALQTWTPDKIRFAYATPSPVLSSGEDESGRMTAACHACQRPESSTGGEPLEMVPAEAGDGIYPTGMERRPAGTGYTRHLADMTWKVVSVTRRGSLSAEMNIGSLYLFTGQKLPECRGKRRGIWGAFHAWKVGVFW